MSVISSALVHDMIRDWLETPVNGYLGSGYGNDLQKYLHKPLAATDADLILDKLRFDVRVLEMIPADALNLYSTHDRHERAQLFLEISGHLIELQ